MDAAAITASTVAHGARKPSGRGVRTSEVITPNESCTLSTPCAVREKSKGFKAMEPTVMSSAKLATFDTDAMNAAAGAGAPSYVSGAHRWNGTAATLNPSPAPTRSHGR